MNNTNSHLQDEFLNQISTNNSKVSIYLVNGIKLIGYINSYDETSILLQDSNSSVNQLIYKHAISTIVCNNSVGG